MALGTIGTLGTDPNYGALGVQHDPRLLMAQKLMDVGAMPTNNSTQSSFWANLLNQGARGALGGYMYGDVQADREKERVAQEAEAKTFREKMERGPPGGSGAGTAPAPRADAGGAGTSEGSAGGDLVAAVHHLETRGRMAPGIYGDGGQAAGPMQVHPGALADVNRAQGTNYTHDQLAADPELGRKVGVAYLTQLRQQFGRDDYALGAYNAGPGVMRAAIANGQGVAGLPPRTQQYVTEGLARMRGRQADAGDVAPGSNMEAMLSGVNQAKPRGMQLAERVALGGGGNTATDSPTPILSAPVVPVASAALQGVAGPQPPSATVPQPPPASVPAPPSATVPQPEMATVPQPEPAVVPQPEMATVPPPMANMDPPALASLNGVPQPEPAVVPQPEPAVVPQPEPAVVPQPEPAVVPAAQPPVPPDASSGSAGPAGSGETGGQPTALPQEEPPLPVPPVPPGLLAQRLRGGGDNATEALNAASLAAARRGESFAPGAGPSGQQLAAPLMSWAGNLGADGAPLLTPQGSSGGPTGPQLAAPLQPPGAAPLVTPTSGPSGPPNGSLGGDPGATGGQSKWPDTTGAAPAQHPPADAQAQADWYLSMAREAAGSSNPKIRAQAGVLEAQGTALQRRIDRQDALDQQLGARREAASERAADRAATREDRQITHQDNIDLRRQTAADTAAGRAESAADRKERIRIEEDRLKLEREKFERGGQSMNPDAPVNFSKDPLGTAYTTLQAVAEREAKGPLSPAAVANRETARKIIQQHAQTVPTGAGVSVTTPPMPDYSQAYPPPGGAPTPAPASPAGTQTGPNTIHIPNPAQPAPPSEVEKMLDGTNSLRNTGLALRSLQENPDAVGPMKRIFPNLQQWMDPKGAITQAAVDDIGSQLLHARSGAAISPAEFDRLSRFVPNAGDPYEVSMVKIQRLHRAYGDMLANRYSVYGPGNKATPYQAIPDVEDAINEFRYPSVPKGRDARQTETMLDSGATYTLPASLGGGRAKWNAATHHFDPIQEGK